MADSSAELRSIIAKIAEDAGYECVGVEVRREKRGVVLRAYIDKPGGIMHDDCEKVSREVASYIDGVEEGGRELISGAYFVEVSSPGIERPLFVPAHYVRFVGSPVAISLGGWKKLTGVIETADDDRVVIRGDDGEKTLAYDEIKSAHLVYVMPKGEKKGSGGKKK